MTPATITSDAAFLTEAQQERRDVKTEAHIRAWAERFMVEGSPPSVAEEIGAMYHEMVQRVYGVGGG